MPTTERLGLNRLEAAEWVRRHTGYALWNTTLRNWERFGLLRNQTPGRRNPACYTVPDLVAAAVVSTLRRDGASLRRVRAAHRALARLLPDILNRPGEWRLAVDSAGHVHCIANASTLLELTKKPGQLSVFHAGELVRRARAAVAKA